MVHISLIPSLYNPFLYSLFHLVHPLSITATAWHFQFQFCPHYLSLFLGIFGDFWCLPCVCVWYGQFLNAALVVEHVSTCSMSQGVVMRFDFEQCSTNWCENWFRLHVTCLPNCCTTDRDSRAEGKERERWSWSWRRVAGVTRECAV